jgi:hypothetical protein
VAAVAALVTVPPSSYNCSTGVIRRIRGPQTFEGVSNLLLDNARNLIYITNGEGLWILSHNVPPHPICDSEITGDASCYAY